MSKRNYIEYKYFISSFFMQFSEAAPQLIISLS